MSLAGVSGSLATADCCYTTAGTERTYVEPKIYGQAMIMAKRIVSQSDEKYEDKPGTKRPRDFLAVLYETDAEKHEKYGEVPNFDADQSPHSCLRIP